MANDDVYVEIEKAVVAGESVAVATVATILLGARLFDIRALATAEERAEAQTLVEAFDENDGIESPFFFKFATVMLLLFILTIAMTSALPVISDLGMGFVALAFATAMLIRYKSDVDQFYKAIDWDLIIFFMSLFVVINVMEHARVLGLIGQGIGLLIGDGESSMGTGVLLLTAAVFSSVTDNIPLAAMLAKILSASGTPADSPLWWSVVFGANLGGNITPIGSASTLVAVTLIHKYKLPLSFAGFVGKALPYAALQLGLAVIYVLVFVA